MPVQVAVPIEPDIIVIQYSNPIDGHTALHTPALSRASQPSTIAAAVSTTLHRHAVVVAERRRTAAVAATLTVSVAAGVT
jgi:hypothetical protein